MREAWAARYIRDLPADADFEQVIVDGLKAVDKPSLIVIEHDAEMFSDGCSSVAEHMLGLVARAWASADEEKLTLSPPVVVLSLVTGDKAGPRGDAFLPTEDFPGKAEAFARELEQMTARHPDLDWLTTLDPLHVQKARPGDFDAWLGELAQDAVILPDGTGDAMKDRLGDYNLFRLRFARIAAESALAGTGVTQ
jgi:hypothetical protein